MIKWEVQVRAEVRHGVFEWVTVERDRLNDAELKMWQLRDILGKNRVRLLKVGIKTEVFR